MARRLSGGGAVFHDLGNLNFTFLVPTADYDLDKQLKVIELACEKLGVKVERSGRNDILADGRKFSGNAFYKNGPRAYHHGTLMVDVDREKMGRYLNPSKAKLSSKGVDSVRSRVVNLKELASDTTIELLSQKLADAFGQVYGLTYEEIGLLRRRTKPPYSRCLKSTAAGNGASAGRYPSRSSAAKGSRGGAYRYSSWWTAAGSRKRRCTPTQWTGA
ncbi:MAG: lipoate--protein ligase family protein [Christensenellales bacterium]